MYGADENNLSDKLFVEFGNLGTAWDHAVERKAFAALDKAVEGLYLAYDLHGWIQDGIKQSRDFIDALRIETVSRTQQIYLGRALTFSGMIIFRSGDHAEAHRSFEEAIKILRAVGDTSLLFPALIFCGIVTSVMGDLEYPRGLMDEGAKLAEENHHGWFTALGTFDQGFIAGQAGDLEYAYERMQKGLSIWREIGNTRFIAFALNYLSPIAIRKGLLDDADAYLNESLTLSTRVNDRWGMGTASGRLGNLALLKGDLQNAKRLLEKSLALFTDLGARWDIGWALTHLGRVAIASKDLDEAKSFLKRAIRFSLEAQAMPQAIDAALELAECYLQMGNVNEAAELVFSASDHPASTDEARLQARELKSVLEHRINPSERGVLAGFDELETVLARLLG